MPRICTKRFIRGALDGAERLKTPPAFARSERRRRVALRRATLPLVARPA